MPQEPPHECTRAGPKTSLFPLEHSPGRVLHRANVAMRAGLLRTLRDSGFELSIEEWVVLSSLWDYGEMAQPDLGDRVGKDRHFVSRLLDSLEERRLVVRRGVKDDRRIKRVKLTAEGEKAKEVLSRSLSHYLSQVFSRFSQADYDAFLQGLEKIIAWHTEQHARGVGDPLPTVLPSSPARASSRKRVRTQE